MPGSSQEPIFVDNLPVNFIQNHLEAADEAFAPLAATARYDSAIERFVPSQRKPIPAIEDTPEMVAQKQSFIEALAKYQEKTGKGTDVVLDKKHKYSWDDVLGEIHGALQRYQNIRDEGMLGRVQHWMRGLSEARAPIESWLSILPAESWQASVLCGGLKIVLNAATRLSELREEIGTALERIPITICKVSSLLIVYEDTYVRREHVSQVFVLVLQIFEDCLRYFRKGGMKKAMGAILQSDAYGRNLQSKISALQTLESRIDEQAIVGLHNRVDDLQQTVTTGARVLNDIRTMLMDDRKRLQYQAAMDRQLAEIRRREDLLEAKEMRFLKQEKARFLRVLDYKESLPLQDLRDCISIGVAQDREKQNRAAWILQCLETKEWLSSPESSLLVVNGNAYHHERNSAVSLFSALLVRSLAASRPNAMVLHWFCGQQSYAAPESMVASLLGQLLTAATFGIVRALREVDVDVATLFKAFKRGLRAQLQRTHVYCICDSISFYEDRDRMDDLESFCRSLIALVSDDSQMYDFKVLLTSPITCRSVSSSTDGSVAVITAPRNVPEAGRILDG